MPNTMWELSRRCSGRRFLLHPDGKVVDTILFCFGYCAERWGISMHQLTLMHNHYHASITDQGGTRVDFTMELHALIARCIKNMRGRDGKPLDGSIWDASEQTGRVMLVSEPAFIEACAYAIANPVAAGLVHSVSNWTSFVSRPSDMQRRRAITIRRPACLPDSYPATATLRFVLPAAWEGQDSKIVKAIEMRVVDKQREARKQVVERQGRFRTRKELMSINPLDAPKTSKRRNVIIPALRAARASVLRAAKKQLIAWRRAYRIAFERFRNGERDVEWPSGTWFYARYAGVRVAPVAPCAAFGIG